jgi:hypothetical protein
VWFYYRTLNWCVRLCRIVGLQGTNVADFFSSALTNLVSADLSKGSVGSVVANVAVMASVLSAASAPACSRTCSGHGLCRCLSHAEWSCHCHGVRLLTLSVVAHGLQARASKMRAPARMALATPAWTARLRQSLWTPSTAHLSRRRAAFRAVVARPPRPAPARRRALAAQRATRR